MKGKVVLRQVENPTQGMHVKPKWSLHFMQVIKVESPQYLVAVNLNHEAWGDSCRVNIDDLEQLCIEYPVDGTEPTKFLPVGPRQLREALDVLNTVVEFFGTANSVTQEVYATIAFILPTPGIPWKEPGTYSDEDLESLVGFVMDNIPSRRQRKFREDSTQQGKLIKDKKLIEEWKKQR